MQSPSSKEAEDCAVLVVDDEPALRSIVARMLRRQGYDVLEAAGGEEAVLLFAEHRGEIALLLTDVVMPGIGGPALAQRLVADKPTLRVIFMSGYAEHMTRELDDPFRRRFLKKPFRAADLIAMVSGVLAQAGPDSPSRV